MSHTMRMAFLTLVTVSFARAVPAACASLDGAARVKAALSPSRPACFLLSVKVGEAVRLAVQQPVDIEIRVLKDDAQTVFDGFEFGSETATLIDAGEYRIELRTVGRPDGAQFIVLMSREGLSLQAAVKWREAEDAATRSKRSGKLSDIAESLAMWNAIGDHPAIARTELKQGDAALNLQKSDEAGAFYEEALATCIKIPDTRCAAEAANNSGYAAQLLGDFDLAMARLTQAVEAWEKIGRTDLEGLTLSNLGLLLQQTGDYQQAIARLDRASALLRPRDPLANARVLNNLGLCYRGLAENEKARDYFARALNQFVSRKSPRDEVRARLNLARTWLADGNMPVADKLFSQALAEAVDRSDRAARADILHSMGQSLIAQHRAADAGAAFQKALDLHRTLHDRRMEAFDLHYLGVAGAALDELAPARDSFQQALAIRRDIAARDAAVDSLVALADLEHAAGNFAAARDYAEQALKAMESVRAHVPGAELRASYYSRRRKLFDLLIELEMLAGGSKPAEAGFVAAERGRGRALLDLLAEGAVLATSPPDLLERRTRIERQIDLLAVRLSSAPSAVAAPLRQKVELLVAEDDEVEARIRQDLADPKLSAPLASAAEVQSVLPADAAILEYYLGETESFLWLVRKDDIQLFRLPARARIEAECAPVLRLFPLALERKRFPEKQKAFDSALRRLSRTLLGPLPTAELPSRLILVPDGVLTSLPFAALEFGAGRLGLSHDLVQATSAAYLTVGRGPRRPSDFPKAFLAFVDPVFSPKDPRVPAARVPLNAASSPDLARLPFNAETDALAALVPPSRRRVLRGFDANPRSLRGSSPEDYAVLHFSTHAFIDDRIPELSRIALSLVGPTGRPIDGFLRTAQLSALHLNGSTVVLSACQTALGKQVLGEGLAGFTASLFHAGAAQLVLALSDVDAEGSSEFLARTYQSMFGSGKTSVERAMMLARRSLARSPRWSDPWYWASFTVYGRPREEP